MKFPKPSANAALIEMMAAEHEAKEFGVAGESLPANPQIFPAVTLGSRFPPPDWEQEARERIEREHEQELEERARIVAVELARIAPEDQEPDPVPKKRGWRNQGTKP